MNTNPKFCSHLIFNQLIDKTFIFQRNETREKIQFSLTPRVFPDPVCAMPTLSSPDRATGHIRDWMGVGLQIPCLARRSLISSAQNIKLLHYSSLRNGEKNWHIFSNLFLITLFKIKQHIYMYVCLPKIPGKLTCSISNTGLGTSPNTFTLCSL